MTAGRVFLERLDMTAAADLLIHDDFLFVDAGMVAAVAVGAADPRLRVGATFPLPDGGGGLEAVAVEAVIGTGRNGGRECQENQGQKFQSSHGGEVLSMLLR